MMTHPLTPREKVAVCGWCHGEKTVQSQMWGRVMCAHCRGTGIETFTALASVSGDHAELAKNLSSPFNACCYRDECKALLVEITALKYAVQNGNEHLEFWETRAAEAERALAEHRIAADLLVSSLKADLAEAERELDAVSSAIGTVRFMDPPDGGDVPLSEQVRRMASALTEAGRKLAEAVGLVERSIDLMTDEYADTKAYREEARALISKEAEGG